MSKSEAPETGFKRTREPCQVRLCAVMGTDATAVDAARISFRDQDLDSDRDLTQRDTRLLKYLIDNEHTSPFRHMHFTFYIKAPEFVMRQLYKHVVGIETTAGAAYKDHGWSEVSGRYKEMNEIYVPKTWHTQHKSSKQCSAGPLDAQSQDGANFVYNKALNMIETAYFSLLEAGVSKEEARMVLPLSFMTEVIWTPSLQAVMHFIRLRDDPHAQHEIQVLARELLKHVRERAPVCTEFWIGSE